MEDYYGKNLVFVAGGIGLIPLRSCIIYALAHRDKYEKIQIFYGAKTPKDLMYLQNLREWEKVAGVECHLTVDRAEATWKGNVGVVGSLFKKPGVQVPVENTVAFVCGPPDHVPLRHQGPAGAGLPGRTDRLDAGALHEMRRRQVRPLLHRRGLRLRGRPGLHLRANPETRRGHLMPDLREQLEHCFQGRVCLMGIGNVDHGDDGLGVRLAEQLAAEGLPDVVVAGTAPERFIGRVAGAGHDHVIFLDAVEFGGAPGSVVFLDAEEMTATVPAGFHAQDLAGPAGQVDRRTGNHQSVAAGRPAGIAQTWPPR